jgi:predicted N-acetyltransferase YhbS
MAVEIRMAAAGDAEAIAALHAESWRSTYRGTFSDPYLDGEAPGERLRHWIKRLRSGPRPDQGVLVAMEDGVCVGFICIHLESETAWGPALDNLHVRPDRKGRGIGSRLIREGLAWIRTSRKSLSPSYAEKSQA